MKLTGTLAQPALQAGAACCKFGGAVCSSAVAIQPPLRRLAPWLQLHLLLVPFDQV